MFNAQMLGVQLSASGFIAPGRLGVSDGPAVDLDLMYRRALAEKTRFEIGLELRTVRTPDANHYAIGLPLRFALGLGRHFEMNFGATPGYTNIDFVAPYFQSAHAFMMRLELGLQFPIIPNFALGFSPLGFTVLGAGSIPVVFAYEPRVWAGAAFL